MKNLTLILSVLFLLLLNGCGSAVKGMMIYDTDASLQSITQVKALPTRNSVGFEWNKIDNRRVHGVNVYRSIPTAGNQTFERIGSTSSRYATHFVDTHVKPNRTYLYTFTTFSLGKESKHGTILNVRTLPPLSAVPFAKAYVEDNRAVKLLWAPHTNQSVSAYRIERAEGNGEWKYLTEVSGQLSVEYVDTFVLQGHQYRYRIFAKSYDGILSQPSQTLVISL
jgi:hypothetical protein